MQSADIYDEVQISKSQLTDLFLTQIEILCDLIYRLTTLLVYF